MKPHQHSNEIIVTELRPMSEAPRNAWLLVYIKKKILPGYIKENYLHCGGSLYSIDSVNGWLPMPQYRPELKQTKEDIHHYYGA